MWQIRSKQVNQYNYRVYRGVILQEGGVGDNPGVEKSPYSAFGALSMAWTGITGLVWLWELRRKWSLR
jgi:hypothetical protein